MSNYTKLAIRGTVIVLVISLFAGFLGYLVRLVLARNLTVEDFGLFNAVFSFLGLLGIFKSLGFDKALVKFIPEFKHEKNDDYIKSSLVYVSFIQLITNSIIIILVYLLSNYLSINFFHTDKARNVLNWLAISFFIDSFVLTLKFAFQGFKKMVYFSSLDVVRMILVLVISLIGFKLHYGLFSPVIAYILTPLLLLLIFGWLLIADVFPEFLKSKFIFDIGLIKRVSKYSIFVTETSVAGLLLYYTDTLVLTYFKSLKDVGLYSVALPTAKIFLYFPRAIGGMLLPLTSELWAKKEQKLLKDGMLLLYKYSIILIVPMVLVMFSFTDLILTLFYGKNYIGASNPMKILSIGMIFAVLYAININFFAGIGKPQLTSKVTYIGALLNLIMNLMLVPFIGMIGAALATSSSYFVMMIMSLWEIKKLISIEFPMKIWSKTLAAGIILTLIIWYSRLVIHISNIWIRISTILIISGLCYLLLLFLLKVIDINELKVLYKRMIK